MRKHLKNHIENIIFNRIPIISGKGVNNSFFLPQAVEDILWLCHTKPPTPEAEVSVCWLKHAASDRVPADYRLLFDGLPPSKVHRQIIANGQGVPIRSEAFGHGQSNRPSIGKAPVELFLFRQILEKKVTRIKTSIEHSSI